MKVLAFSIGILIGCTILMIISFAYRFYWDAKLKKEIKRMKTQPLENGQLSINEIREMYFKGKHSEE